MVTTIDDGKTISDSRIGTKSFRIPMQFYRALFPINIIVHVLFAYKYLYDDIIHRLKNRPQHTSS